METFAVYWEPIIKTYGICERTGLCLVTLDLPFDRIGDGGDWLTRFASRFDGALVLIFSRPATPAGLRLHLLLDRHPSALEGVCSGLRVDNPVEMVYFQGPHYGDRYGIAGAAVSALAKHGVPLLAVVCTGASVYLITPKGMAGAARTALGNAFSTPEAPKNPISP